ncbi:hypothetical protein SCOR_32625 [Sulfidibacter corallicola]|uniref:Uncharacterized protein n=1 Tax=Sulfidibacter corallicola TaxID=2818388 RepID=A0A8A4TJE4_SULCO|nr:OTU domain-containing protein [Sulfidibacter corallicola]QTD49713.1 hypothetical protein J3U87_29365 [Sulfidibacter corallicola]
MSYRPVQSGGDHRRFQSTPLVPTHQLPSFTQRQSSIHGRHISGISPGVPAQIGGLTTPIGHQPHRGASTRKRSLVSTISPGVTTPVTNLAKRPRTTRTPTDAHMPDFEGIRRTRLTDQLKTRKGDGNFSRELGHLYGTFLRRRDWQDAATQSMHRRVTQFQAEFKQHKRDAIQNLLGQQKKTQPKKHGPGYWADKSKRIQADRAKDKGYYAAASGSPLAKNPTYYGMNMQGKSWMVAMTELRVIRKHLGHRHNQLGRYQHHVTELRFPGGTRILAVNEKGGGGGTTRMKWPLPGLSKVKGNTAMLDLSYPNIQTIVRRSLLAKTAGSAGYSDAQLAQLMLRVLGGDETAIAEMAKVPIRLGTLPVTYEKDLVMTRDGVAFGSDWHRKPAYKPGGEKKYYTDLDQAVGGVTARDAVLNIMSILFLAEPRHALGTWLSTEQALHMIANGSLTFADMLGDLGGNIAHGGLFPGQNYLRDPVKKGALTAQQKRLAMPLVDHYGHVPDAQKNPTHPMSQAVMKSLFLEMLASETGVQVNHGKQFLQNREARHLERVFDSLHLKARPIALKPPNSDVQPPTMSPEKMCIDRMNQAKQRYTDARDDDGRAQALAEMKQALNLALQTFFPAQTKTLDAFFASGDHHGEWQRTQAKLLATNSLEARLEVFEEVQDLIHDELGDLAEDLGQSPAFYNRFQLLPEARQEEVSRLLLQDTGLQKSGSFRPGTPLKLTGNPSQDLKRLLVQIQKDRSANDFQVHLEQFFTEIEKLPKGDERHALLLESQKVLRGLNSKTWRDLDQLGSLGHLFGRRRIPLIDRDFALQGLDLRQWHTHGDNRCAYNGFAMGLMALVHQNRIDPATVAGVLGVSPEHMQELRQLAATVFTDDGDVGNALLLQGVLQDRLRTIALRGLQHNMTVANQIWENVEQEIRHRVFTLCNVPDYHVSTDLFRDQPEIQRYMDQVAQGLVLGFRLATDQPNGQTRLRVLGANNRRREREAVAAYIQKFETAYQGSKIKPSPHLTALVRLEANLDQADHDALREALQAHMDTRFAIIGSQDRRHRILNMYTAAMFHNRDAWGGPLELQSLGRAFGVQVALLTPFGVNDGGPGFGSAVFSWNTHPVVNTTSLSENECAILRRLELIHGEPLPARNPRMRFKPHTRAQVIAKLQDHATGQNSLAQRFLHLYDAHYRQPPVIAMNNPNAVHWSAVSLRDGTFDVAHRIFHPPPRQILPQLGLAQPKPKPKPSEPKPKTSFEQAFETVTKLALENDIRDPVALAALFDNLGWKADTRVEDRHKVARYCQYIVNDFVKGIALDDQIRNSGNFNLVSETIGRQVVQKGIIDKTKIVNAFKRAGFSPQSPTHASRLQERTRELVTAGLPKYLNRKFGIDLNQLLEQDRRDYVKVYNFLKGQAIAARDRGLQMPPDQLLLAFHYYHPENPERRDPSLDMNRIFQKFVRQSG